MTQLTSIIFTMNEMPPKSKSQFDIFNQLILGEFFIELLKISKSEVSILQFFIFSDSKVLVVFKPCKDN